MHRIAQQTANGIHGENGVNVLKLAEEGDKLEKERSVLTQRMVGSHAKEIHLSPVPAIKYLAQETVSGKSLDTGTPVA